MWNVTTKLVELSRSRMPLPSININTRLSPVLESNSFVITCSCEIISLSTGTTTGYNGMETAGILLVNRIHTSHNCMMIRRRRIHSLLRKIRKNIFILFAKNELIMQKVDIFLDIFRLFANCTRKKCKIFASNYYSRTILRILKCKIMKQNKEKRKPLKFLICQILKILKPKTLPVFDE